MKSNRHDLSLQGRDAKRVMAVSFPRYSAARLAIALRYFYFAYFFAFFFSPAPIRGACTE